MNYRPELERLEDRLVPYNFNGLAAPYVYNDQNVGKFVVEEYHDLLGRDPTPAETARWELAWFADRTNAAFVEQVRTAVAQSAEFIGGQGRRDWIKHLFVGMLGRQGSAAEVDAWTERAGVIGLGVAQEFAYSPEKLRQHVLEMYPLILDRQPSLRELLSWDGHTQLQFDLELAGSAEFYSYHPNTITGGVSDHNWDDALTIRYLGYQ